MDLSFLLSRVTPNTAIALGGLYAFLVVATVLVWLLRRARPGAAMDEVRLRVLSWWVIIIIVSVAMGLGPKVTIVYWGFLSFLALKEYYSIIPTRRADRRVMLYAYLAIPVQYYFIWTDWYGMFIIFIPVYMFLFLPFRMVLVGETRNWLHGVSSLHWGLMAMVFGLSHICYFLMVPAGVNPKGGGAGLIFFLIFLTQFNDVAQFVWGKLLGRHKVVPLVSPGKTWEGLLGGIVTTTAVAWALSPYLTPMAYPMSLAAGVLIAVSGFIGDVTISALKRDLGIKDTGNMLPGHGGILDRIDSLIYTGPLFFHFTRYFYY
ncbi:MAG: phosphatidate cytidylyltransferase [bacterium]